MSFVMMGGRKERKKQELIQLSPRFLTQEKKGLKEVTADGDVGGFFK